jgi:hypothetical protein
MKTIQRAVGSAFVLAMLGLLSGCAAAPKTSAPSSAPEAVPGTPATAVAPQEEGAGEPATLADAEALLEKARTDLNRLALNEAVAPLAGAAPPSAQMAPAPSPAPARDEARRAEKSASSAADGAPAPATAPANEVSTCQTACKAFSSLTRASDAVCRLDTEGGKRCERARQIREDASRRVASCSCSK